MTSSMIARRHLLLTAGGFSALTLAGSDQLRDVYQRKLEGLRRWREAASSLAHR